MAQVCRDAARFALRDEAWHPGDVCRGRLEEAADGDDAARRGGRGRPGLRGRGGPGWRTVRIDVRAVAEESGWCYSARRLSPMCMRGRGMGLSPEIK